MLLLPSLVLHLLVGLLLLGPAASQGGDCTYFQLIQPGETFNIFSPNYPNAYSPGAYCTWTAYTPANGRLVLSCDTVQIPKSQTTCVDYLVASPTNNLVDGKNYCGSDQFIYVSPGQQLTLTLVSDNSKSWGGRFGCSIGSKLIANQTPPASANCDCGYSYKWRIVGGVETGVNEFPMMAGLISSEERRLICGATIISRQYVVTAAHCLTGRNADTLAVLVGDHNLAQGTEAGEAKLIRASSVIVHEAYDPNTQANDIALVRTAEPIAFTMRVGPACLPWNLPQDFVGSSLTALGWGTKDFGGETSDSLQKVDLASVSLAQCSRVYGSKIRPGMQLCTYGQGKDACQFDSGGPLLYFDPTKSRYFDVGVISYGQGCGFDQPSVNTKVSSYLNWIRQKTPDQTYCVK